MTSIATTETVLSITSVNDVTWTIEGKRFLTRKPKGMREIYDGQVACAHRDVSVCENCESAIANLVEISSQHYWVRDYTEWRELVGELCAIALEYAN